jgi:triphosphoribosyl-dephospho-CoA synthase
VSPLNPLSTFRQIRHGGSATTTASSLADLAVQALIDEAELTPKPALVDRRGSGAHTDLNLDLMLLSARTLHPMFKEMAIAAADAKPSQPLRENLAKIGRVGEDAMQKATRGVNTHRGAIWTLGLLVAGAAICRPSTDADQIAQSASEIAQYGDRFAPVHFSNGAYASRKFGVKGARGEASSGFPHVIEIGLPVLRAELDRGVPGPSARLNALMAIMADLDDTCLLHRGGALALRTAKEGAKQVLACGGTSTPNGSSRLQELDRQLLQLNASPGGAADLLAATLFLDAIWKS